MSENALENYAWSPPIGKDQVQEEKDAIQKLLFSTQSSHQTKIIMVRLGYGINRTLKLVRAVETEYKELLLGLKHTMESEEGKCSECAIEWLYENIGSNNFARNMLDQLFKKN